MGIQIRRTLFSRLSGIALLSVLAFASSATATSDSLLKRAQADLDRGDYFAVTRALKDEKDARAFLLVGRAHEYAEDGLQPQFYNLALAADPKNVEALCREARIELKSRRFREAIATAKQAATLAPKSPIALSTVGYCFAKMNVAGHGQPEIQAALKLDPKCEIAYIDSATIYLDSLEPQKAEETLTKLISIYPRTARLYLERARLYKAGGKRKLALDDLNKALAINPHFTKALFYRADIYQLNGDEKKAIEDLERSVHVEDLPDMKIQRLRLEAHCHEKLQDWKAAEEDLRELLADVDKMPHPPGVMMKELVDLASCYDRTKDYARGIAAVDRCLRFRPNSTEALYIRARLNEHAGSYATALKEYSRLISLDDTIPDWFRSRATVLHKMGKDALADRDLQKAAALESATR